MPQSSKPFEQQEDLYYCGVCGEVYLEEADEEQHAIHVIHGITGNVPILLKNQNHISLQSVHDNLKCSFVHFVLVHTSFFVEPEQIKIICIVYHNTLKHCRHRLVKAPLNPHPQCKAYAGIRLLVWPLMCVIIWTGGLIPTTPRGVVGGA